MPLVFEPESASLDESADSAERLRRTLAQSREEMRGLGDAARENAERARALEMELAVAERAAHARRRAMTEETFRDWIGRATGAAEWTRRAFTSSIGAIGRGLADELVDGTHDWQTSLRGVLRQMIAITAQMVVMRSLMTALTGGGAGWLTWMHAGGPVLHAGGPLRAHAGLALGFDEVPIVAQRGEFVMRRRAVERIGPERLERANRGEAIGGDSFTFHVNVTAGGVADARGLAERIGPELVEFLRREKRRGAGV